jgi:hypothetical protein
LSLIDGKKSIRQIGAETAKDKLPVVAITEPRAGNLVSKTKHEE